MTRRVALKGAGAGVALVALGAAAELRAAQRDPYVDGRMYTALLQTLVLVPGLISLNESLKERADHLASLHRQAGASGGDIAAIVRPLLAGVDVDAYLGLKPAERLRRLRARRRELASLEAVDGVRPEGALWAALRYLAQPLGTHGSFAVGGAAL